MKNFFKKLNPFFLVIGVLIYILAINLRVFVGKADLFPEDYVVVSRLLILEFAFLGFLILLIFPYLVKGPFSKKKNLKLLLFFSLLIGFLIRIVYAANLPFTNDEGAYLYDGLLISEGSSPFLSSFARSPVLVYTIAAFINIFGRGLITSRLFNIVFALGVAINLYLIGRELKSEKAGIIASLIFSLIPPIVSDTVYLHTQTFAYFWVLLSIYLIIVAIKTENLILYLYSSGALAFAVLIRETTGFYLPLLVFLMFKFSKGNLREKLKKGSLMFLLFIFLIFGIWSAIGFQVGFKKVYYDLFALVTQRTSNLSYRDILGSKLKILSLSIKYFYSLLWLIIFSLTIFFRRNSKTSKISIWAYAIFISWFFTKIPHILEIGEINNYWLFFLVNSFVFFISSLVLVFYIKPQKVLNNYQSILLLGLFLIPFVFYFFYYSNFQTEYWIEFWIPAILFVGIMLDYLYPKDLKNNIFVFSYLSTMVTIIAFSLFGLIYILNFPQRGTYPISNLRGVVHYLNINFSKNEEVFTGAVILPYLSGHRLALNITHPSIYCNCVPISDEVIYTLFPEEEEIISYLETNSTKMIILEKLTLGAYFNRRPKLSQYLAEKYSLGRTFGVENPIRLYVRQ